MNSNTAYSGPRLSDRVLPLARLLMASHFVFSGLEKCFVFDGVVAFAEAKCLGGSQ